jgi:hypothetical protein
MIGLIGALLLVLSACNGLMGRQGISQAPTEPQGLELVNMTAPKTIQAGAPYDVVVDFKADGEPSIRKVCLRWVKEGPAKDLPSTYCYVFQAEDRLGNEESCMRWMAEGSHAKVSPLYCTQPSDVQQGPHGRFIVELQTSNIRLFYDKIECYAEYVYQGKIRRTNKVSSPISVEYE